MAIEFNCPYCTATIRVPDAYAGKQGRCPKCDTKLLIPSVPIPGNTGEAVKSAKPVHADQGPRSASEGPPESSDSVADKSGKTSAAVVDLVDVRPVTTSIAKSRRRSARLHLRRTLVIGVPVICFLVLFGIIAYSLTSSLPKLEGHLTGHRLEGRALPSRTIAWSDLNLQPEDRQTLQEALSTNPESLVSQYMACRLSASDKGMIVTLNAQSESQWIAVDVSGEKPLAIWRRKEGPEWNRMRLNKLHFAVNRYAKDKLLKINGQQIAIDAVATRDDVALNAHCGPLGFLVHAVTDSMNIPCAAEDEFGKLYFCLPKIVQNFSIQGRVLENGASGFNGKYSVTILKDSVTIVPAPVSDESTSESAMPENDQEILNKAPDMIEPKTELKE